MDRLKIVLEVPYKQKSFAFALSKYAHKHDLRLISMNNLVEQLGLNRVTVEKGILSNVRHYEVEVKEMDFYLSPTGTLLKSLVRVRTPRQRIYIDTNDLMTFLIMECGLVYERIAFVIDQDSEALRVEMEPIAGEAITDDHRKMIINLLRSGDLVTSKTLGERISRARTSTMLLGRIIDSVIFRIPSSKRNLRRYLFHHPKEYYEDLLKLAFKRPQINVKTQ